MSDAVTGRIQELVGHSTLCMTLRDMHLAPSALWEATDLLNKLLGFLTILQQSAR